MRRGHCRALIQPQYAYNTSILPCNILKSEGQCLDEMLGNYMRRCARTVVTRNFYRGWTHDPPLGKVLRQEGGAVLRTPGHENIQKIFLCAVAKLALLAFTVASVPQALRRVEPLIGLVEAGIRNYKAAVGFQRVWVSIGSVGWPGSIEDSP